jgi:5-hydroxyisourate hydrolase-like protein (transthyretin family)
MTEFVQGDTKPDLTATLKDSTSGDPIDLSNVASIRFQMREANDRRYTVNAAAVITDTAAGRVTYSWAEGDLSRPGTYQAQFEIHYTDLTVQTTDPTNEITVRRQ